jgi:hypothetical protein
VEITRSGPDVNLFFANGLLEPIVIVQVVSYISNRFRRILTICIQDVQKNSFPAFKVLRKTQREKTRPAAATVRFFRIYNDAFGLSNVSEAAAGRFIATGLEH